VAFESQATNLVVGDTNGMRDVFVRDRTAGKTERVSVSSSGGQGNNLSRTHHLSPAISGDGRYVVFSSKADNLVVFDVGGFEDIFLRDRTAGTTVMVSVNSMGFAGESNSYQPTISADGRYVAFGSDATILVPNDTNLNPDVFVRGPLYPGTDAVIAGTLALTGVYPLADPSPFTITLHPTDGSANITRHVDIGPDGVFSLHYLPLKKYLVHIKGEKYLAINTTVDVTGGSFYTITGTVTPGDVNNDNTVNIGDLGPLADAFGALGVDPLTGLPSISWNPDADLNGDGKVNITDLGILASSFGLSGDP
jgi:hypothetical protein